MVVNNCQLKASWACLEGWPNILTRVPINPNEYQLRLDKHEFILAAFFAFASHTLREGLLMVEHILKTVAETMGSNCLLPEASRYTDSK